MLSRDRPLLIKLRITSLRTEDCVIHDQVMGGDSNQHIIDSEGILRYNGWIYVSRVGD